MQLLYIFQKQVSVSDHGVEELENGWCFLENVQDPNNPTGDCFEDTQFSVADGRFWSNEACNVVKSTPEGKYTFKINSSHKNTNFYREPSNVKYHP